MRRRIAPDDIVGRRFGRLTVTEYLGIVNHHHRYLCKCDCGNTAEIFRDNLLESKANPSCGHCWHIEDEGDYLRYYCANGDSFIFDKRDYKLAWKHRWHIDTKGYVKTNVGKATRVFSRMLLQADDGVVVDHINRDTRDNRRVNLRIASRMENARNEPVRINNRCGFKGVSLHLCGKYRADIGVEGKIIYLGLYPTAEEAAHVYDDMARKLHGEYARLNFPLPGERGCREVV